MMDHLSPERVAEIVERLMPIGGETEERRLLTLDVRATGACAVPANDDDLSPDRVAEIVARLMPIGGETEEHRVCISALSMAPHWMPLHADLAGSLSAR